MSNPDLSDRIISGIDSGISRSIYYSSSSHDIKPEYLLTVATADKLITDFYHIGYQIKLEADTRNFKFDLRVAASWKRYISGPTRELIESVSNRGKVDIYIKNTRSKDFHLIEIKGFDPQVSAFNKDLIRLSNFLSHKEVNPAFKLSCYIAFPTTTNRINWIKERLDKAGLKYPSLKHDLKLIQSATGDDPEGDIPYYIYCVRLYKK